jgi:hypothetical protein
MPSGSEPVRATSGKIIPVEERMENWLGSIKDGLMPTPLGTHQKMAIEQLMKMRRRDSSSTSKLNEAHLNKMLQANNIVFPRGKSEYLIGDDGLKSIAEEKSGNSGVFQLQKYHNDPWFYPNDAMLGSIASKLKRVVDIIRKSQGIVLVYSHFISSGIVPLAVALEHIGFKRYNETDSPMLANPPKISSDAAVEPYHRRGFNPAYAILCGSQAYTGRLSIAELMNRITQDENKDGSIVKVVLMSRVASEGLSFKNVREIHILDPWYHLNRLEQVIGRGIRTCSHSALPIEERNVTVYLHATIHPIENNMETDDLHAYRISARKQQQISYTEKVLRDFALDCPIQKDANFVPKKLFAFTMNMRTSHGIWIPYAFGDSDDVEPKCEMPSTINTSAWRKDAYQHVLPTVRQRLKKYFNKALKDGRNSFSIEDLLGELEVHPDILKEAIASLFNTSIDSQYLLKIHKKQIVLAQKPSPRIPIRVQLEDTSSKDLEAKTPRIFDFQQMMIQPNIFLILGLEKEAYIQLVQKIVRENPAGLETVAEILHKNNLLTLQSNAKGSKYIEYVDFFNDSGMRLMTWSAVRNEFVDSKNSDEFFKNSIFKRVPPEGAYGIFAPKASAQTTIEFKIVLPGNSTQSKNQGAACKTNHIDNLKHILTNHLHVTFSAPQKDTREFYCDLLRRSFLEQEKLWLVCPSYSHSRQFKDSRPHFIPLIREAI